MLEGDLDRDLERDPDLDLDGEGTEVPNPVASFSTMVLNSCLNCMGKPLTFCSSSPICIVFSVDRVANSSILAFARSNELSSWFVCCLHPFLSDVISFISFFLT